MKSVRPYRSAVREAQARETRERILASAAEWMQSDPGAEFTLEAIAAHAGIERRTIHRHFQTKEGLIQEVWAWINARMMPSPLPTSLEELVEGPRQVFGNFDKEEGLIRASLHTPAGRAMRMAAADARRTAFHEAIVRSAPNTSPADLRRFELVAHALFSAAAWETLRDYAEVSGIEAGEAASWALEVLSQSLRSEVPSQQPSGDSQ